MFISILYLNVDEEYDYIVVNVKGKLRCYNHIVDIEETREGYQNKSKCLSKREKQILKLLSNGLSNKEISKELGISANTVKNHMSNIFRKLEVSGRTEAAVVSKEFNKRN